MQALQTEGQNFNGFLVTKYLPVKELQSSLIELVHEDSGARIIHIANDDPDNLFALSFQTIPGSSNGVAHVLEHTVLCGSEKFPIKDPFFAMLRRSLNTFMNAMTGLDFTVYPASSQVEIDFYNLLEVYLDAVFHPELKHLSFLQEGHRLSFAKPGDIKSPLVWQGVVYNEMKGAMSSADERLTHALFRHLMPDLPYAFNSGGDPKQIPTLTYEDLIEFHRTFYHPSRCLFFFYGNIPLAKHLDFLTAQVLSKAEKIPLLPPLPAQQRFSAPWHAKEFYPVAPNEETAQKTMVAIGFLTTAISNQADLLALNLIDSLLTDTDVSPLKYALLQSKLCTTVESSLDTEMSEAPWLLICKGCDENAAEQIVALVRSTLEKLVQNGFDPGAIKASLHQLEFERTEIGGDGIPFGLSLFFRAVLIKQHGAEPEKALLIHSLFRDFESRLADPAYLPQLLRRFFLDNPHAVYLTMAPDPKLGEQEQKEEMERLALLKEHLSRKQLEGLLKQEKELEDYQKKVEHQSIECLPKITLHDVPARAKDYPLAETAASRLKVLHHACFTNRIIYANLDFDLPAVPFDDLRLLSLFTRFLPEIGSGGRSYAATLELQQAALGELSAAISLHVQHDDPTACRPTFSLRAKALARKAAHLLDLLRDTAASPNWRDSRRLEELLSQHATDLEQRLAQDAMSYAVGLASGGFSLPASIQQELQGLPYYCFIQNLVRSGHKTSDLEDLSIVLGSAHPSFVLTSEIEQMELLAPHLSAFAESLPEGRGKAWKNQAPKSKKTASQGRIIASPVAFTALAFQTVSYIDPASPALMVATDLLENVVLHNEIREKGGAYGSGAAYSPASGQFHFYSYRDPHLSRTYSAFLEAISRIAAGKFTSREIEEAKLGILQDLDAPLPPRLRGLTAFGWLRSGRSYDQRDAFRRSIIEASSEEVAAAVAKHLAAHQERGVFVAFAGEELLKKEKKKLPFSFEILPVNEKL